LSYDFNDGDPDPFPDNPTDNHGTPAAGVAGNSVSFSVLNVLLSEKELGTILNAEWDQHIGQIWLE
jgi:subtilisin family serine protease